LMTPIARQYFSMRSWSRGLGLLIRPISGLPIGSILGLRPDRRRNELARVHFSCGHRLGLVRGNCFLVCNGSARGHLHPGGRRFALDVCNAVGNPVRPPRRFARNAVLAVAEALPPGTVLPHVTNPVHGVLCQCVRFLDRVTGPKHWPSVIKHERNGTRESNSIAF
jgi:hypothetical protein